MPKSWKIVQIQATATYEIHLHQNGKRVRPYDKSFKSRDEAEQEIRAWQQAPIEDEDQTD